MLGWQAMSADEGARYTFNGHREALYRILEATVRGHAGCPDAGADDNRRRHGGERGRSLAYPSPFLWYEEIRPSDVDAYHAVNRRSSNFGDGGHAREPPEDPPPSHSIPASIDPRWDPDALRAASKGAGAGEAGAAVDRRDSPPAPPKLQQPADGYRGEQEEAASELTASTSKPCDRCTCAEVIYERPPCDTRRRLHGARDEAGSARGGARGEGGVATDGGCCSDADAREGGDDSRSMTPDAVATTTTPPDPSQATQTMFLPGLPSQVLVTQRQGDDEGWDHPEGDESRLREEGDEAAAASAYESSLTYSPCLSPAEDTASSGVAAAPAATEAVAERGGFGGKSGSGPAPVRHNGGSVGGREHPLPDDGSALTGTAAATHGGWDGESHHQKCASFSQALRQHVGREEARQPHKGCVREVGPAHNTASYGSGGRHISTTQLSYVPTLTVLPRGWSGGQAGVVAFLEDRLVGARKQAPDGYIVRALALACHVLRQPSVCVKSMDYRGAATAAGIPATEHDGHPEVVGVAGFVWKLLRADGGGGGTEPARR